MADGLMRGPSLGRYRALGGYKPQEEPHMGSTVGQMDTGVATVALRDDVNDGLRNRLSGLSLPAPIAVVAELRALALSRLDAPATQRIRKAKR